MMTLRSASFALVALPFLALLSPGYGRRKATVLQGRCVDFTPMGPMITNRTSGCIIPDFVDRAVFGDNLKTNGKVKLRNVRKGLRVEISLKDLSKPDLVLTAWLVWEFPAKVQKNDIFQTAASVASPCAPSTAAFTTGLADEPNQFKYVSKTSAVLDIVLNFNPTYPNEAPLTFKGGSLQKSVPGIQDTKYRQYPTPGGTYTPTTSAFLRQYDKTTGFEILGRDGRPVLVRSPINALGIAIASHVDKTTHGVSQGEFPVDHYEVIFFPLPANIGYPVFT